MGIELRSSGVKAGIVTSWAILPAQRKFQEAEATYLHFEGDFYYYNFFEIIL